MNDNMESLPIFPEVLPIFPIKNAVFFPFTRMDVVVSDELAKAALKASASKENYVMVVAQKVPKIETISEQTIYLTGTVGLILKKPVFLKNEAKTFIKGFKKALIKTITYDKESNVYYARIETLEELPETNDLLTRTLMTEVKQIFKTLTEKSKMPFAIEFLSLIQEIYDPTRLAEVIFNHFPMSLELSQEFLEENSPIKKLTIVRQIMEKELALIQIQNEIKDKAMASLGKSQKEFFLKEQMKQIQKELGNDDSYTAELLEYSKKLEQNELPEQAAAEVKKQLERLKTMNPAAQETVVLKTWIDSVFDLPWKRSTEDNKDIIVAKKILENDHFGLEEIKERILEFLAVRQVRGSANSKSPILCFVGPPGVGKTSLGKSIARALKRNFYRLSLGGLHDEAEIRGHRRTYVGAMPGKILDGLKNCKSNNPVFMLDEIDKLGKDFRGDPSSALLEVLDPEQNFSFLDNYVGIPFDLSKVFFIATANWEDTIPEPLKDRMEIIRFAGYTDFERIEIAKKYLIPRQLENNGLAKRELLFSKEALLFISRRYAREAGVRNMERHIGSICRKTTTLKVQNLPYQRKITPKVVEKYLKLPPFSESEFDYEGRAGVVSGLAWTQFGGSALKIESNWMKGKGNLILTGQLGDIMKESARIALSFIQSNVEPFGLGVDFTIENKDIHIHFPAGAIPKDGPSAGITITTALLSLFLKRVIDPKIAMTGEISLTGEVLPIGGLKEKLLAAKRNGIIEVFIPEKNRAMYESINDEIKGGVKAIFVKEYFEIFKFLFK